MSEQTLGRQLLDAISQIKDLTLAVDIAKGAIHDSQVRVEELQGQVAAKERELADALTCKACVEAGKFCSAEIELMKFKRTAEAEAEKAKRALFQLKNEAQAVLHWEPEIERAIGRTNLNVFKLRITEAEAALTPEPASQTAEGKP